MLHGSDRPPHFYDFTRGVATSLDLKAGHVLYHGTLASKFTHEYACAGGPSPHHYTHPPTPDGPAWFADSEKFSLHAAVRFTRPGKPAEITVHSYDIYQSIGVMSLPTIEDFRIFMHEQFQMDAPFNGFAEGMAVAKRVLDGGVGGYALMKDTVRGEPEYVLFEAGMRELRQREMKAVCVLPISENQSRLVEKDTGKQLALYTYGNGPGELV